MGVKASECQNSDFYIFPKKLFFSFQNVLTMIYKAGNNSFRQSMFRSKLTNSVQVPPPITQVFLPFFPSHLLNKLIFKNVLAVVWVTRLQGH